MQAKELKQSVRAKMKFIFFTICLSCPSYMLYACHALVNAILDRVFAHVTFGQAKTKIATCLGVTSRAKTLPAIMQIITDLPQEGSVILLGRKLVKNPQKEKCAWQNVVCLSLIGV
jgi:hypothetical protein